MGARFKPPTGQSDSHQLLINDNDDDKRFTKWCFCLGELVHTLELVLKTDLLVS